MSGQNLTKTLIVGGMATVAGCCTAALALADTHPYSYSGGHLVPGDDFTVTGLYGNASGQPAEPGQFQGTQTFTVYTSAGKAIGTVDALVGRNDAAGNPHLEILVAGAHPDTGITLGTAPGDMPNVGSVFNWAGSDPTHPSFTYSALAGYDVHNPPPAAGTGNVVDSNTKFDAASHIDVHADETHIALPSGGYLVADPHSAETYTGISNGAPFASAVQGTQVYDVYNSTNHLVGKVDALTINTADIAGGNSQEVFVTNIIEGTPGMTDGDVPTVGSVFNYLNYFGFGTSVYTDYAADRSAGIDKDTVSQLWNMFGFRYTTTPSFDAVHGFTDHTDLFNSLPYQNAMTIVPLGEETYTGINGMPNGGVSGTNTVVQGTQDFNLVDSHGNVVSTFSADETTFGTGGVSDETLYITGVQGAKDVLPVGSTVEYTNHGWFSTVEINTDPLGTGAANETTQMLSIPLLGGAWTDVAPGSEFGLSLLGITF